MPIRPTLPVIVAFVVAGLGAIGCTSDDDPPTADELVRSAPVVDAAARGGVTLADDDAICVADGLEPATLDALVSADDAAESGVDLDSPIAAELSEVIVDCVGQEMIARSALAVLGGSASDESLDCAAAAFDRALVQALVQQQLEGRSTTGPAVEIEISTVFAACFTVEELLEFG